MKNFILSFFIIGQAYAQHTPPSGPAITFNECPFNETDQESSEVLGTLRNTLTTELNRLQSEVAQDASCAGVVENAGQIDNLISILANDLTPREESFQNLMLGDQRLACTANFEAFSEVVVSYQDYVLSNLGRFPENSSSFQSFLELTGSGAYQINAAFSTCHGRVRGAPSLGTSTSTSGQLESLRSCLRLEASNQELRDFWQRECGRNQGEYRRSMERLRDQLVRSDAAQFGELRQNEDIIRAAYTQLNRTVYNLSQLDGNCSGVAHLGSAAARSLASVGMGIASKMGGTVIDLGLNLLISPINSLINRIATSDKRAQRTELQGFLQAIDGGEKQMRKTVMCAMWKMQRLVCDGHKSQGDSCDLPGSPEGSIEPLEALLSQIRNFTDVSSQSSPDGLTFYQENSEEINSFYESMFSPQPALREPGSSGGDPNFFQYLYGSEDGHQGVMNEINLAAISDGASRDIIGAHRTKALALKPQIEVFREATDAYKNSYSAEDADRVKLAFTDLSNSLRSQSGAAASIPALLTTYYQQQVESSPDNSEIFIYALRAQSAIALAAGNSAVAAGVVAVGSVATREENASSLFDFMVYDWTKENVLKPMINQDPPRRGINETERRHDFDSTVKNRIRDCLFMYQSVMSSNDRRLKSDYGRSCQFLQECPQQLGIDLPVNGSVNYNSHTDANGRNIENYAPICSVSNNYNHILSKARANWIKGGSVCPQ